MLATAPFVADPLPQPLSLAFGLVAGILAAFLIFATARRVPDHLEAPLGLAVSVAAAAAAFAVGLGATAVSLPQRGPEAALAAGLAAVVVAVGPITVTRDAFRLGSALIVLLGGPPSSWRRWPAPPSRSRGSRPDSPSWCLPRAWRPLSKHRCLDGRHADSGRNPSPAGRCDALRRRPSMSVLAFAAVALAGALVATLLRSSRHLGTVAGLGAVIVALAMATLVRADTPLQVGSGVLAGASTCAWCSACALPAGSSCSSWRGLATWQPSAPGVLLGGAAGISLALGLAAHRRRCLRRVPRRRLPAPLRWRVRRLHPGSGRSCASCAAPRPAR